MTDKDRSNSGTGVTIRLPGVDVLFFLVLELHFLAAIGFSVFGLVRGRTNFLFGSFEDISRFWVSLILAVLVYFFSRNRVILLSVSGVVLLQHVIIPLGSQILAGEAESWRDLAELGSGGLAPTGFQTAMFMMDLSLVLLIGVLIASYPSVASRIARAIALSPIILARRIIAGWRSSKLGERILGIALSLYIFNVLVYFGVGLLGGYLYLNGPTIDDKARVLFTVLLAVALAAFPWRRGAIIWLSLVTLLWEIVLVPLVTILSYYSLNGLSDWNLIGNGFVEADFRVFLPAIQASQSVRGLLLFSVALVLVTIGGFKIVRHYAKNVSAWFDARHLEVYGTNPTKPSTDEPRDVSVMSVLSLVFAFIFPIVGLILSYSARNSIVYSKGRKTGLELTIAASIISWFGLIVSAFFIFVWVASSTFLAFVEPASLIELIFSSIWA